MKCIDIRTVIAVSLLVFLSACSGDDPQRAVGDTGITDASDDTANDGGSDDTMNVDVQDGSGDDTIRFGPVGTLSTEAGLGSFRFGAATAAAQIEDGLTRNDWYAWTLPESEGGAGNGTFVGDAVQGATRAVDDVALVTGAALDAYRFSVDWSRIEPDRDVISEEGLAHYDAVLDALVAAGVRPMITVHHFSSPLWVDDFLAGCGDGPSDTNLCGWAHPEGGPLIVEELAEHAALLAARYGDRVDDWCTLNEPVNYIIASYGAGVFPPGRNFLLTDLDALLDTYRHYLDAHAAVYDAIRANDTIDADGDGLAAEIGLTLSVADWVPARGNEPSDDPADVAAAERVRYVYHELIPRSILDGTFDADFDGEADEQHPSWAGKLDWMGVQYYFRAGATADPPLIQAIDGMICFGTFDFGSCLPPEDPTHWVPSMGYEFWAPGWYATLMELTRAFPGLPLTVTEGGIAAENGVRRAENIVRTLEQIHRAMQDGADVRGYYHWSLMDNFEWAEGYEPRFGLYRVDHDTGERTPTEGVEVLREIATSRSLPQSLRDSYGGNGPMAPELEQER